MREIADRVLVIFEFEKAIYERANVPVDWVGHPLLDVMPPSEPRGTFVRSVGLAPGGPVVALLPGSRRNELREILPRLVDAANTIRQAVPDVQFVVARAPHLHDELFKPLESLSSAPKVIVEWPDRSRARGGGCRDRRVGHGHCAGGAARMPHGRRVSVVPDDVRAGPTLRPRRHIRNGQPSLRAGGSCRNSSG